MQNHINLFLRDQGHLLANDKWKILAEQKWKANGRRAKKHAATAFQQVKRGREARTQQPPMHMRKGTENVITVKVEN